MRKMVFYNKDKKDKNKSTLDTLANALNGKKQTSVNTGGISASPVQSQNNQNDNTVQGAIQFGKGLYNLYNQGKQKGWFDFGNNSSPSTFSMNDFTSAGGNGGFGATDSLSFTGTGGGIDNLSFMGSGSSGAGGINNLSFANLGSDAASSAGSSGGGGWGGFGGGSGGGAPWGAIAGFGKNAYNYITDKTPSDYSDLEQTIIYPTEGAAKGYSYGGPWGALGGALYGLGYSFKDDIGLKDNNWFTDILFPIGMGDEHQGLIQL